MRHNGRLGHSGGPAEDELRPNARQVAEIAQPIARRRFGCDREGVGVLRRRRGQRHEMVNLQDLRQGRVRRDRVGAGRLGSDTEEPHRGTGVLGHQLHQPASEGGGDELAWTEIECSLDLVPATLECLAVDLGQQLALREVEGADGDAVVIERTRRGRIRRTVARAARPDRHNSERKGDGDRMTIAHPWAAPLSRGSIESPTGPGQSSPKRLLGPSSVDR